jgi:phospholipid/cholesterol/gamma-HCH transport system substrate-binding protein
MNDSRFAWRVGFFVFVGMLVAALLILNFSKGITLFQSTYNLHMTLHDVAGLKPAADVMLAGVPIGKVVETTLSPDGRTVDVKLEVLGKYKIRRGADFAPDSQGFLGDQYVEVTPPDTAPPSGQINVFLTNNETVIGKEPLNMQQAVRSVSGLLDQAHRTIGDIGTAVTNINRSVLTVNTLSHVAEALSNFDSVTINASAMAKEVRAMLDTNTAPVQLAVSNFVALSDRLNETAAELHQTIATNSADVDVVVKNLRDTSVTMKQLADGLQAGQGLAGKLLKDEQTQQQFSQILTNISDLTAQYSLFGQNLNKYGVWRMLWKPKAPETNSAARK